MKSESIDLSVSNVCDNNCVFCSDRTVQVKRLADFEEVVALLNEGRQKAITRVEFSALEPLLRKDIITLLQKACELGYKQLQVVTNGHQLADKSFCQDFISAGITDLTISMHSHTAALESKITNNKHSFEKKKQALQNLKALGAFSKLQVSINIVLNTYNYKELPATLHALSAYGVKRFNVFFPRIVGKAFQDFARVVPLYKNCKPSLDLAAQLSAVRALILSFVDIPFCVVTEGRKCINKRRIKDIVGLSEHNKGLKEFSAVREKEKRTACQTCIYNDVCEGVYTAYIKKRGWEEFIPVLKE